jgi:anionic cell wall polymer biosynthesis LytR-Cps2A-Psr (LCP) family protein
MDRQSYDLKLRGQKSGQEVLMRKMKWMMRFVVCCVCALLLAPAALAKEELRVTVGDRDLSIREGLPKDLRNIAVVICDPREESRYAPTDTMMLATINTRTGDAWMTLLQPDLLVDMPLIGVAPLSDAYALGGANLVMKTLNEVLDLNVRDYVSIDLGRFSAVVEAVGGIRMRLTGEEAAALGLPADAEVVLDLEQTLAFMRLPRENPAQNRQYDVVMQALYQGTQDREISNLTGMLQRVLSSMDTKIGFFDMVGMGTKVMGASGRKELRLPAVENLLRANEAPPYRYTTDIVAMKAELHRFLYGEGKSE